MNTAFPICSTGGVAVRFHVRALDTDPGIGNTMPYLIGGNQGHATLQPESAVTVRIELKPSWFLSSVQNLFSADR